MPAIPDAKRTPEIGGKAAKDLGAKGDTGWSFFAGRGSAAGAACFALTEAGPFAEAVLIREFSSGFAIAVGAGRLGADGSFDTVLNAPGGLEALGALATGTSRTALSFARLLAFILLFNTLRAALEVAQERNAVAPGLTIYNRQYPS